MFCVVGVFVMYQLPSSWKRCRRAIVSHTLVRACNQMTATSGNTGCGTIIATWNTAVEKIVWHDE